MTEAELFEKCIQQAIEIGRLTQMVAQERLDSQKGKGQFTLEDIRQMIGMVRRANKIGAIKIVRNIGGMGLVEAKDFVESLGIEPMSERELAT